MGGRGGSGVRGSLGPRQPVLLAQNTLGRPLHSGSSSPPPPSQCTMGHWKCEDRPCPRRCALEGGSFVTTFDARPYRFHGTCTYTLLQVGGLPRGVPMGCESHQGYR